MAVPAAKALGRSHHPGAVQPLLGALREPSRPVQIAAAEALLELGPLAARPLQQALQSETSPWLKEVMASLLAGVNRAAQDRPPELLKELGKEWTR